jgi:chromatin segregation and condensation protein Rec8/ScpA/Scc1 (kleisin family)
MSVEKISFSLPERIGQILTRLFERPRWFFRELLEGRKGKAWVVVTFLALLEMARRQQLHLRQESHADDIQVEVREAA